MTSELFSITYVYNSFINNNKATPQKCKTKVPPFIHYKAVNVISSYS